MPVALMTPYGASKSNFMAVGKDFKLAGREVVRGGVGHDRIQQASAPESIGEAIRKWYGLARGDFERMDVEIDIRDGKFYITPIGYKLVGRSRSIPIQRPTYPLSFTHQFRSELWQRQLTAVHRSDPKGFHWAQQELQRVITVHRRPTLEPDIQEQDLLRASGPLNIYGVRLGPYVGRGYDCKSEFQFLHYLPYEVPVEIKKRSAGFRYQKQKYGKEELSRAVVLCVRHDLVNYPDRNIDILELGALAAYQP